MSRWLIDKSAYMRLPQSPDAAVWWDRIDRGLVGVASVTLLELGFSARSGHDWRAGLRQPPVADLVVELLTPAMENRALEIQGLLADRGYHRAVKIPDLIIGAVAEIARYTVLHVDKDFDLIAEVSGQPVERLAGDF